MHLDRKIFEGNNFGEKNEKSKNKNPGTEQFLHYGIAQI